MPTKEHPYGFKVFRRDGGKEEDILVQDLKTAVIAVRFAPPGYSDKYDDNLHKIAEKIVQKLQEKGL